MQPTQSSQPYTLNHREPTPNMQNTVPNIRIVSADTSSGGSPAHHGLTYRGDGASVGVNDLPSSPGDTRADSSNGNNGSAIPSKTSANFYAPVEAAADAQLQFDPTAAADGNDNYGPLDSERSEAVGLGSSGGAGASNRQSSTSPTAVPTQLHHNPFNGVYDRGKKKKKRRDRHLGEAGKSPSSEQCLPDGDTKPCEPYASYKGYQNISNAHLQNSDSNALSIANQVYSPTESCDSSNPGQWGSAAKGGAGGSLQSSDLLSPHTPVANTNFDDNVPPSPPVPGSPSKWAKLRTTLRMAGAVSTSVAKKRNRKTSTLMRQDSFLKRFSTRHGGGNTTISEESDEEENKYEQIQIQREAHQKRVLRFIINPDENFMFFWLGVLTLSVMYNLWTCIAREAFPQIVDGYKLIWITTDAMCDFVYLLDILVQIRTGYLERGLMVSNNKMLAGHYLRSKFFVLDLCSLFPLDLAQIFIGIHPILRFPRFLKLYRSYRFVYMVETRTIYPNTWRVVNLTHVLFLGSHWFAAFYFMISKAEGFKGTWGYPLPEGDFASVTRMYLKSLYWSTLTLTTIGDLPPPESNWEYVFTIVSYLIGVFVFATIVGQVGNVITNRNASRQEFERLLDGAKAYMRNHNVPIEMQRRVQRWYDYAWSRGRMTGGGDINSLGLLPDKLKTEIALHVNLETLKKVTIFQECEPEFLHDLVLKMRAFIFTPGDLICRKGEVAREMFIIADGLLEVISDSGEVLTQMSAGDFFGEIGILNLDGGVNRRTADVRSVGYSELFVLSREDVLSALKDHPEAEALIKAYGRKRLKEIEDHKRKKMLERLAKRKANSNPASANCSPVHQMMNASSDLLQRVIQLGRKQSISADNLHMIGRALTTTDYKSTLKPDGSTLLERVITLGRSEQAQSQNPTERLTSNTLKPPGAFRGGRPSLSCNDLPTTDDDEAEESQPDSPHDSPGQESVPVPRSLPTKGRGWGLLKGSANGDKGNEYQAVRTDDNDVNVGSDRTKDSVTPISCDQVAVIVDTEESDLEMTPGSPDHTRTPLLTKSSPDDIESQSQHSPPGGIMHAQGYEPLSSNDDCNVQTPVISEKASNKTNRNQADCTIACPSVSTAVEKPFSFENPSYADLSSGDVENTSYLKPSAAGSQNTAHFDSTLQQRPSTLPICPTNNNIMNAAATTEVHDELCGNPNLQPSDPPLPCSTNMAKSISSRSDRARHDNSPIQSPQHEIQIEMEQLPSSEKSDVPQAEFRSGSVRRRRSNGMHETRLSKPPNNQTLGVSTTHQAAFRQSSLPSQLLPRDEAGGRVNPAHEASSEEEESEEDEEDISDEEQKAMIDSQVVTKRKSSVASNKVPPSSQVSSSQSWNQVGEPLWPVESGTGTGTGPGHPGAGLGPANRSMQSFGGLMVSLNTFLQHKLTEYQSAYEERILNLEDDNNSKQEKIRQLENQILTLQRALMDNNSSTASLGDLHPSGGQN